MADDAEYMNKLITAPEGDTIQLGRLVVDDGEDGFFIPDTKMANLSAMQRMDLVSDFIEELAEYQRQTVLELYLELTQEHNKPNITTETRIGLFRRAMKNLDLTHTIPEDFTARVRAIESGNNSPGASQLNGK